MAEGGAASMVSSVKRLYFAGHHFTRDFIGNIAPITAFAAVSGLLYEPSRLVLVSFYHDTVMSITFWGFVLVACAYLVCAYFAGAIANIFGNVLHSLWQRVPGVGESSSYTFWYRKNTEDIDRLFAKSFPDYQYLTQGAAVSPTDKVNILKEYFRANNPGGYIETYRQFLKVDIVRTTLVYAILAILFFTIYALMGGGTAYVGIFIGGCVATSLVLITRELPRRIRKVVRAEYQFIIATAQLRQDSLPQGAAD